jgi:hypothetical protein
LPVGLRRAGGEQGDGAGDQQAAQGQTAKEHGEAWTSRCSNR